MNTPDIIFTQRAQNNSKNQSVQNSPLVINLNKAVKKDTLDMFQKLKSKKKQNILQKKIDSQNDMQLSYRDLDNYKSNQYSNLYNSDLVKEYNNKEYTDKKFDFKIDEERKKNTVNHTTIKLSDRDQKIFDCMKKAQNEQRQEKQQKIEFFLSSKPIKEHRQLVQQKQDEKKRKEEQQKLKEFQELQKQKRKKEMLERKKRQQLHDKKLKEVLEKSNQLIQNKKLFENFQLIQNTNQTQLQQLDQQEIQQKIDNNFDLNYLLKKQNEPKIDEDQIKKFKLPNAFNTLQNYQQQLISLHRDELRSYIQQQLSSNEKLKRLKLDCVLNFVQRTKKNVCQYLIKFDTELKENYNDFFQELDKGVPFIQVKINSQKYFGIKYSEDKNKDSFLFDFDGQILDDIQTKHQIKATCRFISNLKPCIREAKCLDSISYIYCPLIYSILQPHKNTLLSNQSSNNNILIKDVNQSQEKAINLALSNQKIVLIQGPPGTGKSFTIVNLVNQIIQNEKCKGKILICTASNCALDNLLLRIQKQFKIKSYDEKESKFRILRMGVIQDNTSSSIIKFNINYIVNKNYENKTKVEIQDNLEQLYKQLEKQKELHRKKKIKNDTIIRDLEDKIFITKLAKDKKFKIIKERLVQESKIIFSTLNSSAANTLKSLRNQLDYLIIDEATQATEVQNLIPWKYNPQKIILVGDPRQLPATTFHQLSDELHINRSLFERLQILNFPLTMLDTQYRMIENLCEFSSQEFYDGQLHTAEELKNKQKIPLNLQNFLDQNFNKKNLVFVQVNGKAEKFNNSFYNRQEIDCAKELVSDLIQKGCTEIGIITPYQEQVKRMRIEMKEENLENLIEVNTVDGYQGREKNIILISCVRTGKKGIGFLSDARRLNVALTRAKYAVFVLGEQSTLKQDKLWKKLIKKIKKTNAIFQLIIQQWDKLLAMKSRACTIYFRLKKSTNCISDSANQIRTKKEKQTQKNFMTFPLLLKIHLLSEQ